MTTTLCIGQEVSVEQKMLVTKITATWCPNCGTSAWDVKSNIVSDYASNMVFLSTHISGSSDLFSSTARDYATNLPNVAGQPLFYLNRQRFNTNSIENAVKEMVQHNSTQTPLANTGVEMQLNGQVVEVKAKVQFFQPTEGEYYLSLFIIEDNVIANQSNRGSNVAHRKVFRGRVTSETFGELITNGSIEADQTFNFRLNRAINSEWNPDQLEIAAVIWQKVGDTYEFVNVASVSDFSVFTSVNILEQEGVDLAIHPNILSTQSTIQINLPATQKNLSLQLINANGQLVQRLYDGELQAGQHSFSITKQSSLTSGIYFVQLEKDGSSITKRLVIE